MRGQEEDTMLDDDHLESKIKRISDEMQFMNTENFADETEDNFELKQDTFWADIVAQQPYRESNLSERKTFQRIVTK
jgi:hypothetical protein